MAKANGAARTTKKQAAQQKQAKEPTVEDLQQRIQVLQETVGKLVDLHNKTGAAVDESKYRMRRIVDEHNERINSLVASQQQPAE